MLPKALGALKRRLEQLPQRNDWQQSALTELQQLDDFFSSNEQFRTLLIGPGPDEPNPDDVELPPRRTNRQREF